MSYSQRCAQAPIGKIKRAAEAHPDWDVHVTDGNELALDHKKDNGGGFIFGFMDVVNKPEDITYSVACYGGPEKHDELKKLIHLAKKLE